MARQSTAPVSFNQSIRKDHRVLMSSARAGVVVPVAYIPLHAGDSCGGSAGIDISLKEMPKPLLNAVTANFQAWFVPKSCHPQFFGRDELNHARTGEVIKTLGAADRNPPAFFNVLTGTNRTTATNSTFFKVLGLHVPAKDINTDLIDAFSLIYNFRLAAHSSRLVRRKYASEDISEATSLPRAFWPSSRLAKVVPDYERALVVGALDLDVLAGRLPVSGIGYNGAPATTIDTASRSTAAGNAAKFDQGTHAQLTSGSLNWTMRTRSTAASGLFPDVWAEMTGQKIGITLADIDKARVTQAMSRARTAYAGNDATGFDNDDAIIALLMQGIAVDQDDFKRPWLLDSKRVPIGFMERFATDGANLDASVTLGRASARLALNVPRQDVGGMIVVTVEVLPERIDERMADPFLLATSPDDLPNALRDVQRVEPVDIVPNWRVDAKHTTPDGLYGFEPMNEKENRDYTALGGDFYQPTPGAGWTENRSAIWQTEIVNPAMNATHYLAPAPFPHDVFADQTADAFEIVCRHACSISGLTQIGDVLAENNDDYEVVEGTAL